MPAENTKGTSPSDPIGPQTDNTQQDWLELGQDSVAGETLKAKKWIAESRIVDDTSSSGNIHTGTERPVDLNKSDTLTGDSINYETINDTTQETQEKTETDQQSIVSKRVSSELNIQKSAESTSKEPAEYQTRTEAESVVTSGGSDPLTFEERFDEASPTKRSETENKGTTKTAQSAPTEATQETAPTEASIVETTDPAPAPETVAEVVEASPVLSTVPNLDTNSTPDPDLEIEPDPDPEVIIESSAAAPLLSTTDSSGLEDTAIAIDISSSLTDTDGSESLNIIISGVPATATLSAGTDMGGGEWALSPDQLQGLSLTPPANSDENFSLTIAATSTESNGGKQNTVSEIIDVYVEAVADAPTLSNQTAQGLEDNQIALNIEPTLVDTDGSETLSAITITGVPEGAVISAGTENPDGSWSLVQQDLENLSITPPENSNSDFELSISVTSTDSNGSTASSTSILPVTVTAVNDAPTIVSSTDINITEESMEGFSGYGEIWKGDVYSVVTQEEMLAHLGITDVDSDTFTVSLADADVAWHDGLQANDSVFNSDTLASNSVNGDETVIQVTEEFLVNYPTVDAQVGDFYFDHVDFDKLSEGELADIKFSVQVSDGETTSEPREMTIQVTGSNDAPTVSATVTLPEGVEDTSQSFTSADLLAHTQDMDTNDTLSVTNLSVDPSQGTLTTNPDGSFTFTPKEDYNGEVTVNYSVTDGIEIIPTSASLTLAAVNDNPIAVNDFAANQQLQLDGNDTSVVADSSIINDNSEPYTVSIDITPAEQDYGYIISNGGQTGAASGFFITRGVYHQDNSVYQVGVTDENQTIIFRGGQAENGQESNLTFTYDGQDLTVYQDGVDITDTGTIIQRPGRDLPMQNVTLGAPSNIVTSYEFKGETDNVQIYNAALDAEGVGQIQNGEIPDSGDLLVHYSFEGDTPLVDQSGNGHDLQAHGDIQFSETTDSTLSTDEDTALTINAQTLLANDSDVDGDTLAISAVSETVVDNDGNVVGTAVQNDEGDIIFTPNDSLNALANGENKSVHFTYTVNDGHGSTDTATVALTVSGSDDTPVFLDDDANISEDSNEALTGNILSNDTDVDNGSSFSVTGLTGVTVFQDNFDDGNADGWTEISYNNRDTGHWQVTDGAIGERSNSAKGIIAHDMGENSESTNFEVSVDIHANIGRTYNENVGVTFGYEDNSNYYMVKWNDYSENYSESSTHKDFQLVKVEDGQQTIIDQIDHAELPGDFTLSVKVSDDGGISIKVDGEEKLTAEDEHPAINTIGLNTDDNDRGVSYDNVSVINNDIPLDNSTTIDGAYGTLTLNQDGSYSYELNNANNDVQILHDGEQLSETFTLNVVENQSGEAGTEALNITINGTNDGPVAVDDSTTFELETVFQDDFNDGNADGWTEISYNDTDTGQWQVTEGAIGERSNSAKGIIAHDMGENSDSTNFEVSVDIHANSGEAYNENVGVTFAYEDSNNYYMVRWDDYSENYSESSTHKDFQLIKVEDGNQSIIDQIDHAELPSDFNLVVNVSDDGGISIKVDGEVKLTAEDEHPAINTFGLNTDDNDSGISYDNVLVKVASNQQIVTDEDTSLLLTADNLLRNDTDIEGDALNISSVSEDVLDSEGNVVGAAVLDDQGDILFTPGDVLNSLNDGESTNVSLTYTVSDGQGGLDTAIVSIQVTGTSDAPVIDSSLFTNRNDSINLAEDDTEYGADKIYDALDGNDRITGGEADDMIRGGAGNDRISGEAGNDSLSGGEGRDFLKGGEGNDTLDGDSGNDFIAGGQGADLIDGGEGVDRAIYGRSEASVTINLATGTASGGEAEGDTLTSIENISGSRYDDILTGSDEDNSIYGGMGADTINGGAGNDRLSGSMGADVITGGQGDDTIDGGSDSSNHHAGFHTPNGYFNFDTDAEDTTQDVVVFSGNRADYTLEVTGTTDRDRRLVVTDSVSDRDGSDTLKNVEILRFADGDLEVNSIDSIFTDQEDTINLEQDDPEYGTTPTMGAYYALDGDDSVTGGSDDDRVYGGSGNDTLSGNDGSDILLGEQGDDTLSGGADNDLLVGGSGEDELSGGDGRDVLYGGDDNDTLHGGAGRDHLVGGSGDDVLYGGDGNDSLRGGAGIDRLEGGSGNDRFDDSEGADHFIGGEGHDSIAYQDLTEDIEVNLATGQGKGGYAEGDTYESIEEIYSGKGNDKLTGSDNREVLHGHRGDDTINGGGGHDTLYGDQGDDTLMGGEGNDTLIGGDGSDRLIGGEGDDTASYSSPYEKNDLNINLQTGEGSGGTAEGDTYDGIENVLGSLGNDTITGNESDNTLNGGRHGNDILSGGAGNDRLLGGDGDDILTGGADDDIISGWTGNDTVIFSGNQNDYNIVKNDNGSYTVQDTVDNRDGDDTVTDVEQFQFADGTVAANDLALTANLIDGAVEGVEYTTTSGLHGYTDENGGFSFKDGDEVTFNIGGVVLGVATAEDVASGKTFLQDIADVDRTNLNDEYLENMATFLQSLDENSDAYDGIVITDEIREALADVDIDLQTASGEDVQQLVEQIGKNYVSEDAAMDHVEDMLVEHTDLDHVEFQEHTDDALTDVEQSIRTDQKKESQVTAASTTGFDAAEADSATEEVRISEVNDLSLNIPSLDLPNEEQAETLNVEAEETAPAKQEAMSQEKVTVPDSSDDSTVISTDVLADDDLSHALPTESLSNLFDEATEDVEVTPSATENYSKDNTQQQQAETTQVEESVVETEAVSMNTAPAAMDERIAEEADSSELESESISANITEDTEQLETENESLLNTDDLHINLDGESETDTSDSGASEQEPQTEESDNSLDRFSADSNNSDNNESAPLDEFSATSSTNDDKEMEALDTIDDTADNADLDQPEDAGLSDADAIIEDIPQEPEQVDASCAG